MKVKRQGLTHPCDDMNVNCYSISRCLKKHIFVRKVRHSKVFLISNDATRDMIISIDEQENHDSNTTIYIFYYFSKIISFFYNNVSEDIQI
jgi:hypothetical protein